MYLIRDAQVPTLVAQDRMDDDYYDEDVKLSMTINYGDFMQEQEEPILCPTFRTCYQTWTQQHRLVF